MRQFTFRNGSLFVQQCENALENVQICATKLVDGLAKLDYDDRLKRLNLPTLAFRRQRGEMIEIFKHYHTYDRKTLCPSFHPRTYPSRQHNFQLIRKRPKDGKRGLQYQTEFNLSAPIRAAPINRLQQPAQSNNRLQSTTGASPTTEFNQLVFYLGY